jgi:hypothetical protein
MAFSKFETDKQLGANVDYQKTDAQKNRIEQQESQQDTCWSNLERRRGTHQYS